MINLTFKIKREMIFLILFFFLMPVVFAETSIFIGGIDESDFFIMGSSGEIGVSEIISTKQYSAVIGRPVKWVKTINLNQTLSKDDLKVKIPKNAKNIIIKTDDEVDDVLKEVEEYNNFIEEVSREDILDESLTGIVEDDLKADDSFLQRVVSNFITGDAIFEIDVQDSIIETADAKVVEIDEIIGIDELQVSVEYYTEAPVAFEQNISRGKRIIVSGDDILNYTDVLAYTLVEGEISVNKSDQIKLYWYETVNEINELNESLIITKKTLVSFTHYDLDEDGFVDYVEWIVPHLSNQTYDLIIEITNAEHLDNERVFVENIYNEVSARDGVWKKIKKEDYVRVTFEQNLTSERDITIYAKSNVQNARVEVYEVGGDIKIADFWNISDDKMYKIYLTELNDSQNVFDLKIVGGTVEFDYIVDPAFVETSEAIDVSIAPIDEETFVIAWIDLVENDLSFKIMDTDGTVIVNTTDVDTTVDVASRVSVSMINSTHFVIGYIDGLDDDATRTIYDTNGNQVLAPIDVDTAVGANTDVSVAQIGDRFIFCYANDADNDADFKIYDNTGTELVGETNVDNGMVPALTLQNLVECSGISSTRWSYFWFDDQSNDASYEILSETGTGIAGPVDLDANVGEIGQVAVTNLDNNKFTMVFYDSTDQDITIAIRGVDNSVILTPTDIDTTAGTESRVAITTVRENDTSTSDSFVVTWWDQASSDIKVAVYDGTGTELTAPFTIDTQQDTTYRLLDIAGRDSITGNSLCNGTFVVAYSNISNQGIFQTFNVDGTSWNGVCGDAVPPSVFDLIPIANTIFNNNLIEISVNITDDSSISNVLANITYPDSTIVQLTLNNVGGDKYNNSFQIPYLAGRYNISFFANDSENNINDSEATYFNLVDGSPPRVVIVYPLGNTLDEDGDVAITVNVTDLTEVGTILANVTLPNGTIIHVSDFSNGLQSDDFNSNSLGTSWTSFSTINNASSQVCVNDIDGTISGKLFLGISGVGSTSTTICGINSLKRIDGDFDMNMTFNMTVFEPDARFVLRSNSINSLVADGSRVFFTFRNIAGSLEYSIGYNYNNGSATISTQIPVTDTFGKFRVRRFNTTSNSIFNLYYWNNSDSSWVNVFGDFSMPTSARTQFMQFRALSVSSNFGAINMTIEDFSVSGGNLDFVIFNQTSLEGEYNITIIANDSIGFINDTETTLFNINFVNDVPSNPVFAEPDIDEFVSGVINISWSPAADEEGDNLRYNITLLNSDGSDNATIISDYGDASSTNYEWDTTSYFDGLYSMKILVYENETLEGNSNFDILDGTFTIHNDPPEVEIIHPIGNIYDVDSEVVISVDIMEVASLVGTVFANVTLPNSTVIKLSNMAKYLPNDNFDSDTIGTLWVNESLTSVDQTCIADIDTSAPGKMFLSLDVGSDLSVAQCGINSIQAFDGDYDLNVSFNVTEFNDDSLFTMRSNNIDSLLPAGVRVFTDVIKLGGVIYYDLGYNDGTDTTEQLIPINENSGKFRIKRFNSTGISVFNLYYWNNTGGNWINILGNISSSGSSRNQFIQFTIASIPSNFGVINITLDDFSISGDDYYSTVFTQTSDVGIYNISIFANDSIGNVNSSETSYFNISIINDPPSRPLLSEPDVGDIIGGITNISWVEVSDPEGDNLRYNITLLNADGSINSILVSDYGDSSSNFYEWDTTSYPDDIYSLNILVYENETVERYSVLETMDGNFSIHNDPPEVLVIYPLNNTFSDNSDVAISLSFEDFHPLGTIIANITSPNGTSYVVDDFSTGLQGDNFDLDTEGVNWILGEGGLATGHTCEVDIDNTFTNKGFLSVQGVGVSGVTRCGMSSIKRIEGDYDLSFGFNISDFGDDVRLILRTGDSASLAVPGTTAIAMWAQIGGVQQYRMGPGASLSFVPTTDTFGKMRIKRFNMDGTPTFNFSYWNNSGSGWIPLVSNQQISGSTRTQYVHIYIVSTPATLGNMNATINDLFISTDNNYFSIFNQTNQIGNYDISFFVNDTLGNFNDSEITNFNIELTNVAPSAPLIFSPLGDDFIGESYNITWLAVTDTNGDSIRFNISLLNPDQSVNATIVFDYGDIGSTSYELDTSLYSDGIYDLQVLVYENETVDGLSNSDTSGGNFTIDNTAPQITIIEPQNITYNSILNILLNFSVTETNLDSCWYSLNEGNNISLVGCLNTSINVTLGLNDLTLYANDTVGNLNTSEVIFNIEDIIVPSVFDLIPVAGTILDSSGTIEISVNVTDDLNIGTVLVDITLSNTTIQQITLTNFGGDKYNGLFELPDLDGIYNFSFIVNDTAGNLNDSEISYLILDTANPIISFVSPSTNNGTFSQDFIVANISVNEINLDTVVVELSNSTGIVQSNVSLTSSLFVNFTGLSDGTYYLSATANDTAGNSEVTETRTIILDTACLPPSNSNWDVDFADNCDITSAIDIGGYNISITAITGDGTFTTHVNITNCGSLFLSGDVDSRAYCVDGGCFTCIGG